MPGIYGAFENDFLEEIFLRFWVLEGMELHVGSTCFRRIKQLLLLRLLFIVYLLEKL